MTKIDIFSGFLGAGKTTLIKKLISEAYKNEKVVLIENEFGEIGIDGGFLKDAGIEITEMNSGCICCSLVGDFSEALKKVLKQFSPDRVVIEPSGVGKLSDVIKAVSGVCADNVKLNSFTAVVDAKKCKMYMKNFGEFYNDQIESANCIVLSHTTDLKEEKIEECVKLIKEENSAATVVTTPWEELSGERILNAMEGGNTLADELKKLAEESEECPVCGGHHHEHHHEHDHDCEHHHDHSHDHEHEHHHDHDHDCGCGPHHEHGHHHADDVFTSWGKETGKKYTVDEIENALKQLDNSEKYGTILRAKGIVAADSGKWIHFDYVPGEVDVRFGSADVTGRLCVIGADIKEDELAKLFGVL